MTDLIYIVINVVISCLPEHFSS